MNCQCSDIVFWIFAVPMVGMTVWVIWAMLIKGKDDDSLFY